MLSHGQNVHLFLSGFVFCFVLFVEVVFQSTCSLEDALFVLSTVFCNVQANISLFFHFVIFVLNSESNLHTVKAQTCLFV